MAPFGIFTNDTMFKQLGLKVPETFSQLLDVCRKAKAAGTAAVVLAGGGTTNTSNLIDGLVVPMVYGKDKKWTGKLKAGKVTFSGTSGWRRGLQRFVDMNEAGCFQPGAAGVTSGAAQALLFAQGQGLMFPIVVQQRGLDRRREPEVRLLLPPLPQRDEPRPRRRPSSASSCQ